MLVSCGLMVHASVEFHIRTSYLSLMYQNDQVPGGQLKILTNAECLQAQGRPWKTWKGGLMYDDKYYMSIASCVWWEPLSLSLHLQPLMQLKTEIWIENHPVWVYSRTWSSSWKVVGHRGPKQQNPMKPLTTIEWLDWQIVKTQEAVNFCSLSGRTLESSMFLFWCNTFSNKGRRLSCHL